MRRVCIKTGLIATLLLLIAATASNQVTAGDMNVILATLTIKGLSEGTSDITITVNSFQNDNYNEIKDRIAVIPGLITVISGPPTGSKDVDGDGLYEDVNGNERLDFGDVVELFKNFEAWKDYGIYYDFDGDGRLTFGDVVALFKMLP